MKCSEQWLQEWVNYKIPQTELADMLTMAGLEVEEILAVSAPFSKVIIGEIKAVAAHPKHPQLTICQVDVDARQMLQIVCGAPDLGTGMKVAVALEGAKLVDEKIITSTSLGEVSSQGMLCSLDELGLATEKSQSILILDKDAPVGVNLREYLNLEDVVYSIAITPNRGDCLSIKGMAREIAALSNTTFLNHSVEPSKDDIKDICKVNLSAKEACPRYLCRIIHDLPEHSHTPDWMKEKLRRSGMRSIHPVVDVTNYVMLELGQPMHAFDLDKFEQPIKVRFAQSGEMIDLLDESKKKLNAKTLVIADAKKPLAIAGVMGGVESSVTTTTRNILLESAFFSKESIAQSRQEYLIHSESSFRFERGVDPQLQREALERATQLILQLFGGKSGPIVEESAQAFLPTDKHISLAYSKLIKLLGTDISTDDVKKILERLGFEVRKSSNKEELIWEVKVPSYRFDITLPEDLIEEVVRVYGYDRIPYTPMQGVLTPLLEQTTYTSNVLEIAAKHYFANKGYNEVITYSFVAQDLQAQIDQTYLPIKLTNPLSLEMAVMRTSLIPGLITALLYNENRQQDRVRLFEVGTCFGGTQEHLIETNILAGISYGSSFPEQWGLPKRTTDFFDIKGDIEPFLRDTLGKVEFKPSKELFFHPGQSADIYHGSKKIGCVGVLHPSILQKLKLPADTSVFEINLNDLSETKKIKIDLVSKFPEIRRDIAIVINRAIPAKQIQDTIRSIAGDWLKESFVFDVYQGKGIPPEAKSIALALILQHPSRTLVDNEVTELIDRVIQALKGQFNAELRS